MITGVLQVKLAWAIADMSNEATIGVLAGQLETESVALRAAIYENLSRLGGEEALSALLAHWSGQQTIDAMIAMRGAGVEDALVESLDFEQDTERRLGLIEILGQRAAPQAREVLLAQANSVVPEVQEASLRALRPLAGRADVPALIHHYRRGDGAARAAAFSALATACRKSAAADGVGTLLVNEFRRSREAEDQRNWARLLIVVGDEATLPALAGRLLTAPKSPAAAEGIALLKRWPSLAAAPYLKPLCHDGTHGPAALDAVVHLIASSDDVPARLKWLRATQGLAVTTQQKRAYLAAVGGTKDAAAADLLRPYEGDAEVREELEAARKASRAANR